MSSVSFTQCDAPLCTAQLRDPEPGAEPRVKGLALLVHSRLAKREALADAGWSYSFDDNGHHVDLCPEHGVRDDG